MVFYVFAGSPGKRQCLRENENLVKPDTPAIPGVKSRLKNLSQQREDWYANGKEIAQFVLVY